VELTYAELEARSNRLAHHLRGLGVGPETRVGLCVERSPGVIAAMLGILEAGAAYVPLDPAYPAERLEYKLADAGAALVGIDSHNIDDTRTRTRPVHTRLLGAGVLIVEHLTNLGALPDRGFRFTAAPPKVAGMGTFPVRAYAELP